MLCSVAMCILFSLICICTCGCTIGASPPLLLMRGTRWEYGQGVHLPLQILAKLFNHSSFADAKPNLAPNVCGPG